MLLKKQSKYRFEDFEVDLARRTIQRQGRSVTISSRSFELLVLLMRNDQRPVSKEELMHALWPGADVEESNLNQHIFLLRKALSGAIPGEKILSSVPGRGYRFTSTITEVQTHPATGDFDPGEKRFRPAIEPPLPTLMAEKKDAAERVEKTEQNSFDRAWIAEQADSSEEDADADEADPQEEDHPLRRTSRHSFETGDDLPKSANRGTGVSQFLAGFRHPGQWHWVAIACVATIAIGAATIALLPRSPFRRGSSPQSLRLVVSDFENATGNADLDTSIKTALAVDLQQSPYISIEPLSRLTADKAKDACNRLHGQGYVTGSLRRLAGRYLVSVKTFDCATGSKLSSTIGIADSPDAIVSVLDRVAIDLRKQLGESAASIARFNKPLFSQHAASLEALKAYAEGSRARQDGKTQDALTLLQRAVELDPQFALAFVQLGSAYSVLGQKSHADDAMSSAYAMRDTVGERNKLSIEADYHRLVTGDLLSSIRTDKQWHEEYPQDPVPLKDLSEIDLNIGQPARALEAAQQAATLNAADSDTYELLARAQLQLGQIEEAAATCNKAIAQHLDTAVIHGFLYQIGFLRLDQQAMDEQIAWGKSRGVGSAEEAYLLTQQGLMNFAQGKEKAGVLALTHLADQYRSQGQEERANRLLAILPRIEAELGYLESALAQLTRLPEIHGSADIPVAWADTGETSRAEKLLQRELDTYPNASLWQEDLAPQIRAAILLNQHEPEKALAALDRAHAFDLRSFDVPAMTGRAFLAAKEPALAEAAFRKIIDHPGIEPLSYNYPLAQLGLARSLAQQGKLVDATQVYKVVLAIWKDADPDLLRLKDAKAEYAKLSGASIPLPLRSNTKPSSKSAPKPGSIKKPTASKR
jgi:DNA-binding winged helix-turn-helix (wHTH) protein/tetratricopeptide (TPR) repeat protein